MPALQIARIDAFVGTGLLRIEHTNARAKCQAIFFDESGKRSSADTMNVALGESDARVTQVARTLAGLLQPSEPELWKDVAQLIRSCLECAKSHPKVEQEAK